MRRIIKMTDLAVLNILLLVKYFRENCSKETVDELIELMIEDKLGKVEEWEKIRPHLN